MRRRQLTPAGAGQLVSKCKENKHKTNAKRLNNNEQHEISAVPRQVHRRESTIIKSKEKHWKTFSVIPAYNCAQLGVALSFTQRDECTGTCGILDDPLKPHETLM